MKNVVEVKNVVKSFKDKIVLNHVSFSMKPGEIVGFVGQNGAGKSTLMLAAGSCLLTDVVDQLHEDSKKINIVDRLSRHLDKGVPAQAASSYLQQIKKWVPSEPVIHIDDSDVVKSGGYKFESLGIVRDGSESTSAKNVYKKAVV